MAPAKVLLKKGYGPRHATHALDCTWARGDVKVEYVEVPVKDVPPNQRRCRRCGGGR